MGTIIDNDQCNQKKIIYGFWAESEGQEGGKFLISLRLFMICPRQVARARDLSLNLYCT